ncbi:MAG: RNA pseudouridine synthase [Longimonas sp.]|uniref:RluA family pseudouridine synthase n=1 Tax=Longimonas sp. TaxID=2039626 RepID=UPI0039759961
MSDTASFSPPLRAAAETDGWAVVEKPAGLLSQPDATGKPNVFDVLKHQWRTDAERAPFVGLVHRLDRPTSGLLIVAKHSDAARELSEQVQNRTIDKHYLALVEGPMQGVGTMQDAIAKTATGPQIVSPDHPEAKAAQLQYQALLTDDERTLVHVQLDTGRSHQIRLQCAQRGHPVVHDGRYGASVKVRRPGIALHHYGLRFEDPASGHLRTVTMPVPDLWATWATPTHMERARRVVQQFAGT